MYFYGSFFIKNHHIYTSVIIKKSKFLLTLGLLPVNIYLENYKLSYLICVELIGQWLSQSHVDQKICYVPTNFIFFYIFKIEFFQSIKSKSKVASLRHYSTQQARFKNCNHMIKQYLTKTTL